MVTLYVELPNTQLRASMPDPWFARRFHYDGVSLELLKTAVLLSSLRRLVPAHRRGSTFLRSAHWRTFDR